MKRFQNRTEAGQDLAEHLLRYRDREDAVVLALPRGGVPVAFEVARFLRLPLDVFAVRKLGVPGREELAMGAIAEGKRVINDDIVAQHGITDAEIARTAASEQRVLRQRQERYRKGRPQLRLEGKVVLLVDDGIATGASIRAAVMALRAFSPKRIVVAVPVAAPETCAALEEEVDAVVCDLTPHPFYSVGYFYEDFTQVADEDVQRIMGSDQVNR